MIKAEFPVNFFSETKTAKNTIINKPEKYVNLKCVIMLWLVDECLRDS